MKTYLKSTKLKGIETCRLCLHRIDESQFFNITSSNVLELITSTVNLNVEVNDGLPHFVCIHCFLFMKEIKRFKQSCLNAYDWLRAQLSDMDHSNNVWLYDTVNEEDRSLISEESIFLSVPDRRSDLGKNERIEAASAISEADDCTGKCAKWGDRKKTEDIDDASGLMFTKRRRSFLKDKSSLIFENPSFELKVTALEITEDIAKKDTCLVSTVTSKSPNKTSELTHDEVSVIRRSKTQLSSVLRGSHPECQICKMTFCTMSSMRRHLVVHSGEKKYKCEVCERSFSQASILRRHSFSHAEKKPFQCQLCNLSFAQKQHLKLHMEGKHLKIRSSHACKQCGKTFRHQSSLWRHKSLHVNQLSCEGCRKPFLSKTCFNRHKEICWKLTVNNTQPCLEIT